MTNDLPQLSLKHIQPIVDRVHNRYSSISKYQIVIIITTFLETVRKLLLLKKKLTINGLFSNMSIIEYRRNNKSTFKVKLSTPAKMKSND